MDPGRGGRIRPASGFILRRCESRGCSHRRGGQTARMRADLSGERQEGKTRVKGSPCPKSTEFQARRATSSGGQPTTSTIFPALHPPRPPGFEGAGFSSSVIPTFASARDGVSRLSLADEEERRVEESERAQNLRIPPPETGRPASAGPSNGG